METCIVKCLLLEDDFIHENLLVTTQIHIRWGELLFGQLPVAVLDWSRIRIISFSSSRYMYVYTYMHVHFLGMKIKQNMWWIRKKSDLIMIFNKQKSTVKTKLILNCVECYKEGQQYLIEISISSNFILKSKRIRKWIEQKVKPIY